MSKDVRERAIDLIISRGVRFDLPAPRCLKWLLPRSLIIRPIRCGTILHIDRIATKSELYTLLLSSSRMEISGKMVKPLSEAIATAIINNKIGIALLTKPLAQWLRWAVTPQGLANLWIALEAMSDVQSFTTITTSLTRMTTLIATTPRRTM